MTHLTMLWLSVLVILATTAYASAGRCMQHEGWPGYTEPPGDIQVEYGKPLEIMCVLDPEHNATAGTNATDIVFERGDSPVSLEYVQVMNSTTARLYMEHAKPVGRAFYSCLLKPSGRKSTSVCLNYVAIGYPLKDLKIENFTCISRQLKSLNCTWQVPDNPIKTKYSISYTAGVEETRHLNRFTCPNETSPNFGYCYWDYNTHPLYLPLFETYYFIITAENDLGNHTFEEIKFNQWAHALLDKPEFLNGSVITTNSVYLQWQVDKSLRPMPLKYKLLYKSATSECDTADEWKQVDTSNFSSRTSYFNLTDLPYANFLYDVRLYVAPAKAKGDDIWSEPATFTFRTAAMPPASPPELAPGSFQIIGKESKRDVIIFWKRLPRCQENGDDFQYKVVAREIGSSKPELEDPHPKSSYAKFYNLSLNAYNVSVYAVNKEGSSGPAVILIPEKKQTPPQASRIAKDVKENGVVQLTWGRAFPEGWAGRVDSFTVFWCQNEQLTAVPCTGLLSSTVVSREKAMETIQTRPGKVYEFGVAVNAGPASSGITWITCTLRPDSVYGGRVSKPAVLRTEATSLEISFKVDCLNGLKSAHYQVQYCAIDGPKNPECREPMQNKLVTTSKTEEVVNLTSLRPYTTYRLSVVPADPEGKVVGDASEWVNTTTLESRPTAPRDVSVEQVTAEGALVSWRPPQELNGRLKNYLLRVGDREERVQPEDGTSFNLTGLAGHTTYAVRVYACTKGCTDAEPVQFRTPVGRPGQVRLKVRPQPTGRLLLAWMPPQPAGGPSHDYEALILDTSGRNWTLQLPSNQTADVQVPACDANPDATYRVAVRAINRDEDNHALVGNWSEWSDGFCGATGVLQKGRVLLWCVATLCVLGLCAALVVWGRRLARWWRRATGVQVKLPGDLADLAPPLKPDKLERLEERRVHTPWQLYRRDKALSAVANRGRPQPPKPAAPEEAALLRGGGRVARCDSGGGSAGSGSDCALSSLTSATTAASDSDGDAEAERDREAAGGKPRPARQWSTFSDGSVSRSTPNLWEAEAAPPPAGRPGAYCRAGLPGPAPQPHVAASSAPYVRRGSLDGWPHAVAALAAAAPDIPSGYCQMGANQELMSAAELKEPPAVHNHNNNNNNHNETSRGYVPRPVEAAPSAAKQQLVLTPLTHWAPNHNHNHNHGSAVPYVTAASRPTSTPDHARYQQQTAPAPWPSIRCEMPAAAPASSAAARGYISVEQLPPPPASSAPGAPPPPPPAGYALCSSGRPPDGYVSAGPPHSAAPPLHHCKPGGPYVLMGEAASTAPAVGARLPPPSPARGYVPLHQLERT